MNKGGQQVGPSVGTFARLKQENRDLTLEVKKLLAEIQEIQAEVADLNEDNRRLKKEVFDYRDGFMETSTELENLRELQKAAEAIEGPGDWFHKDIRPSIVALHKAIRKVRGMK